MTTDGARKAGARKSVPAAEALGRVEDSIDRLLSVLGELRERTRRAESRVVELEDLLGEFKRGEMDPAGLQRRIEALADENAALKRRMEEGREALDRLLARIRFLEEQS